MLWSIVCVQLAHAETKQPAKSKPAVVKKEVKKHKKFEGTKVPDAPAKKSVPAKKK